MKRYLGKVLHFSLILLFVSCNQKTINYSKLTKNQKLGEGEWLDSSDSLRGISIRGNKIAFFKNMTFTADQIFEYYIFDSISKTENIENKKGEFLFVKVNNDTIIYNIIKRDKKSITLKGQNENPVTYNFWR